MPSAPQTVTTRGVFDYLLNTAGKPIVGATVNCTLNFNGSSVTSPIVNVGELQQSTVTDQNGFWRFLLIPNDTLTPTGTLYSISTPNSSYDISVPSGVADVQSSSILSNVPSVLSPAVTGLTGPVTVTGNETVTGNLTVSGTTSLGSTTTTALTTAAETVGGDLTISSAFRLLFGAAAAKIIPGATSISHRNNADTADNLLITDAGAATVRNGFTLTAGDAVVTAGRLLVSAAAAKILGGTTSLSLRNNADSADNVLVTDAGLVTLRNGLLIPPTAGGALAAGSAYTTVPIRFDEKTPTGGAPVSFTVPANATHVFFRGQVRSDTAAVNTDMYIQFNGDTTASYSWQQVFGNNNAVTSAQNFGATAQPLLARVPAATALANSGGIFYIEVPNVNGATFIKEAFGTSQSIESAAAAGFWLLSRAMHWNVATALTSIQLALTGGNFVAGSKISAYFL